MLRPTSPANDCYDVTLKFITDGDLFENLPEDQLLKLRAQLLPRQFARGWSSSQIRSTEASKNVHFLLFLRAIVHPVIQVFSERIQMYCHHVDVFDVICTVER